MKFFSYESKFSQLLLARIKEPSLDYRTVYTETYLIERESTEDRKA